MTALEETLRRHRRLREEARGETPARREEAPAWREETPAWRDYPAGAIPVGREVPAEWGPAGWEARISRDAPEERGPLNREIPAGRDAPEERSPASREAARETPPAGEDTRQAAPPQWGAFTGADSPEPAYPALSRPLAPAIPPEPADRLLRRYRWEDRCYSQLIIDN